jgi:hypothetical protein
VYKVRSQNQIYWQLELSKPGESIEEQKTYNRLHQASRLLTLQETLALQNENDLVHNAAHTLLGEVDNEISILRSLVRVINTSEALDLATTSSSVDATLVGLLAVLEGSGDVDQEEGSSLGDGVTGELAGLLVGSNGGGDDSGTGAGELSGNEGNALDVGVAVLAGEAQLGGELVADGVTQQQGDGTTTLLVQGNLQSTGDGILAGVHVTGQEDCETLGGARGVGLAQDLDDLRVREPLGDVSAGAQTTAQLGTGDVEGLHASGDLVNGAVLIGVGEVGNHLEFDDLDAELVLVLLDGVLSIVGAVEVLALGVGTRTGVVTTDNEVGGTMVLTDDGVPDGLTGTTHTHGQTQETQDGHAVGVAGKESLVGADTGEVVNVTGLGETDNGVNQDIGLAGTGRADSQLTVGTVHGVTSLESDDTGPAQLVEVDTQLCGGVCRGRFMSQIPRAGRGELNIQRRAT